MIKAEQSAALSNSSEPGTQQLQCERAEAGSADTAAHSAHAIYRHRRQLACACCAWQRLCNPTQAPSLPAAGEGSEAPPPGGAGPPAQRLSVCSVWGTTASSRRSELSSTASCGSTVSRAAPTAATAGAQRHRLGDLRAFLSKQSACKMHESPQQNSNDVGHMDVL